MWMLADFAQIQFCVVDVLQIVECFHLYFILACFQVMLNSKTHASTQD